MCPPSLNITSHQVVVIGGGVAGLTTVKICQDHGIDAHAFERETSLGGVWNHTYKNVRLQQHKDDFKLSGTEWPKGVKDFPDAKAVEAYISKFVYEHNLAPKVTLGVSVTSCTYDKLMGKWAIKLSDGQEARAEHLIVATGALGKPKKSEAAEMFKAFAGEVVHSSEYYDGAKYHGKDVLVVGSGSSGIEISVDLARAADSTTLSVRSDVDWVFPRHGAFGKSLRLCGGGDSAPLWLRNLLARATFRLKYGDLDKYGMKPEVEPLNRRIVVSDEFYPLVAHGAIAVNRGGVKGVKGSVVTFADRTEKAFDAVVLCTGYDVATHSSSHPYLEQHLEPKTKLDFYLGCFLPSVPKCAFVGGCFGFAAVPRIAELQAKAVVNVVTGVKNLPSPDAQKKHIQKVLGFHVQKDWIGVCVSYPEGNTNVYTANSYYRELMEAAGEIRSAALVAASVPIRGGALAAAAAFLAAKAAGASSDSKTAKPLAIAAAALAGVGIVANAVGRSKGRTPAKVSPVRPAYTAPIGGQGISLHPSDSVLSMGSTGSGSSPTKGSIVIKSEEKVTQEGEAIANSRFKTAKEEVMNVYDKWAEAYEHDSLEKLGFASPQACVDTFLKFCPPEGKVVLDVGAGTGLLAQMICKQGYKAKTFDGMDLSPKMLEHLVKKGIYSQVKAHDMMQYPWPFPSNTYDGLMCNGVLIYVDDPECLDEFVRVMKPGGICVIMFRHDGYPEYKKKDEELRAAGKWELVHKTPDSRNFNNMEFGENKDDDVIFNQWVYRVLEESPAVAV